MRCLILSLFLVVVTQACAPASCAREAVQKARAPRPVSAAPVLQPTFKGELATFRITNDNRARLAERVVSFGQVFSAGQVGPRTRLSMTLDGVTVPVQMDAKAMNPDGSVRHAVISVRTPKTAGGATLNGVISAAGQADLHPASLSAQSVPPMKLVISFQAPSTPTTVEVDLPVLARKAAFRPPRWLSGPLVQEQRYTAAVGALQVAFDVWTPAVGPARVDVIFRNDAAQNPSIAMEVYDARLTLAGKSVYEVRGLKHQPYQTWRTVIYADGASPPRVTPDTRLLIKVGATPAYGRFRPDAQAVSELHRTATQDAPPLSRAGALTPYMPTSGGRPEIGPLPAWTAFYVLDPSRQSHETLFANADVAGSIPWHVRDVTTDGPISIDRHPRVWLDYRGAASAPVLNRKYQPFDGVWTIDDAHQPSLTYLPYLLTGSQYYRDELAMQAGYNLLAVNPEYRGGADGIVLASQLRAIAWDLRTLANAAYILPASDPLQPYFQAKLEGNLREMIRRFVKGRELAGAGELAGYVPGGYDEEQTAPWQDDYLVMVLGWIDAMGFQDADPILAWMTNFVAGRFTNAARGYDPIYGTPYHLRIVDPQSKTRLDSWSAAFKASFDPVREPRTTLDHPDWGGGYAALARGALASLINAAPSPQATAAYAYVKAQTPLMEASYPKEPAFAIVPIEEAAR